MPEGDLQNTRRLVLEIKPGSDPIEGLLLLDNDTECLFHGWLELAAVIDRAAAAFGCPEHHEHPHPWTARAPIADEEKGND